MQQVFSQQIIVVSVSLLFPWENKFLLVFVVKGVEFVAGPHCSNFLGVSVLSLQLSGVLTQQVLYGLDGLPLDLIQKRVFPLAFVHFFYFVVQKLPLFNLFLRQVLILLHDLSEASLLHGFPFLLRNEPHLRLDTGFLGHQRVGVLKVWTFNFFAMEETVGLHLPHLRLGTSPSSK